MPKTIASYVHAPDPVACEPGCEHPDGAVFYVSVQDGPRRALLSGPYQTHGEALSMVATVRTWAEDADPRAHWYAFGTCAVRDDYRPYGAYDRAMEGKA